MNYIIAASTDVGTTKSTNQDSYSVKTLHTPQGKMVFAVLCDGMGGLSKGEVASASVVRAFVKWSEEKLPVLCRGAINDTVIALDWITIAKEYNSKIKMYGKRSAVNLGTTITAMLLTDTRYYVINVGDTRAYELFEDVHMITKDQTVVAREVELGNITEQEAKTDKRRNVLLQCIGASEEVYPDLFYGETKKDAVYMLCSDGFRHEINEKEIFHYLNPIVMTEDNQMNMNMKILIELNKQRKESDNISVITIRSF